MKRNPERWRVLDARLGCKMTIWVATVGQDGHPHMTPVWYIWLDGLIYIAIAIDSQKFINLRGNQAVALALPDTESVVILEGEAHVAQRATIDKLGEQFFHKYEWDFRYDDEADWQLVEITLNKVMAWGDGFDGEGTMVEYEFSIGN
jgi:general stress protein 26